MSVFKIVSAWIEKRDTMVIARNQAKIVGRCKRVLKIDKGDRWYTVG
jgi:hypothetical protein